MRDNRGHADDPAQSPVDVVRERAVAPARVLGLADSFRRRWGRECERCLCCALGARVAGREPFSLQVSRTGDRGSGPPSSPAPRRPGTGDALAAVGIPPTRRRRATRRMHATTLAPAISASDRTSGSSANACPPSSRRPFPAKDGPAAEGSRPPSAEMRREHHAGTAPDRRDRTGASWLHTRQRPGRWPRGRRSRTRMWKTLRGSLDRCRTPLLPVCHFS
jgi:hypothetical protein